jgi:hypothetical protein
MIANGPDVNPPDRMGMLVKQYRTARVPEATQPGAVLMLDRLTAGLSRIDERFAQRWAPYSADTFSVVASPPVGVGAGREKCWRVDLAARTVTDRAGTPGNDDDTGWDMVGSADAWGAVLSGHANLGVAMRRCELRYCENTEDGPVAADTRMGMLADLLGLRSSWLSAGQASREAAAPR